MRAVHAVYRPFCFAGTVRCKMFERLIHIHSLFIEPETDRLFSKTGFLMTARKASLTGQTIFISFTVQSKKEALEQNRVS